MENLFSIIIPTLWRSERIHKLIKDLSDCSFVGEIIIIDNNKKFYDYYPSIFKGKIIGQEENLYVGPSWNLGVNVAKYDNIALCNDDINFNTSIFKDILPFIDCGFIGMSRDNYNGKSTKDINLLPISVPRPYGWGCLILFKKDKWINIPEDFKIWYTDDWIVKFNPVDKYSLFNLTIETEMSSTSDDDEFFAVKSCDTVNWEKYCSRV